MQGDGWWTSAAPAWRRFDTVAAILLAALVGVRWPDRSAWLFSWDADTFAIALESYDVHELHPHAPGYPVYVALGRIVNLVLPVANDALVALSLLFTMAAAIGLYALGRDVAGRAVGLAAAILLLAAPVVYVHGNTANAYTAEMAGSVLVACAAWRTHLEPTQRRLLTLAFTLALAIGVRPSLAIYLGPVAAWGALRPPWNWPSQVRRLAPAVGVGVATCLAWFIPMVRLSGGYAAWSEANDLQGGQVVFARTLFNSGWPAVAENLDRIGLFLQWELRFVLPLVAAFLVIGLVARRFVRAPGSTKAPLFLAVWLSPALLFFATVYSGYNVGPSGYVLGVLPGLLLGACLLARWALLMVPWSPRAVGVAAVLAVLVAANGLATHRYDVADVGYKEHDAWAERWSRLDQSFPPSNSSIVALWNFAHVWYHFPEYTSYNFRPSGEGPGEFPVTFVQEAHEREARPDWYDAAQGRVEGPHPLPNGTKHLVLFDFQLAGENGGPRRVLPEVPVREAFLPDGWRVLVVDTTEDRPNLEDYFSTDPEGVPWPVTP